MVFVFITVCDAVVIGVCIRGIGCSGRIGVRNKKARQQVGVW